MAVTEGERLWTPSAERVADANITRLMEWLATHKGLTFDDYHALWRWSAEETEEFWAALWEYFDVLSATPYSQVADTLEARPGVKWFAGATVNFAEEVMANEARGGIALHALSETRPLYSVSWADFASQVRITATRLRAMGVKKGDAVCGVMSNQPETVVALLAALSIGAIWSNAAPEFGEKAIIDRFSQVKPKVVFVCDGYQFGGKSFDRLDIMRGLIASLPSLEQVVYLPTLELGEPAPSDLCTLPVTTFAELLDSPDPGKDAFEYERVETDHPMWVVFSSGTTGLPKAIVQGHLAAILCYRTMMQFHLDIKPGDTSFFYTTTGWIMFNTMIGMMHVGAEAVLYDGNPAYPEPDVLWKMAAETKTTIFGASPTFIKLMGQADFKPGEKYDLSSLRSVLLGGAPSTPETFEWIYQNVSSDVWVSSQSGGTETAGAFIAGSPTLPVYAGEMQCRGLGMAVDSWSDEGTPLIDDVGELVCTRPWPGQPLYLLNDEGNQRYIESYYDYFPGVWRHGDFLKINARGGCYIHGRSDATLNRMGVRIGTAEVYRVVENLPDIINSLVICVELSGGRFFMPLFIQLAPGAELSSDLRNTIVRELRLQCSPRHVPDEIVVTAAIPMNLSGKKLEVPVRKLLLGWEPDKVVKRDVVANPDSLDFFVDFAHKAKDEGLL